ncbi:Ubiquitin 3 binding protein But2 C-terminal domain-containing protein [Madurella fahalii]|uniref:Ubiquitin 3 binding protein But2 C-terminal domain-containing protein n=1 Tax=Madurella fahalii TaxID=1157608 RepID=A0ABQ0FZS8_9PEZI
MSRLTAALALLSVGLATPLLVPDPETETVNVVLQVNKVTSEAAINVWNLAKSQVLAHSCSLSLASGPFENTPLAFTVNEYGAGNLNVGPQTYTIHDDLEISGGIICGRIASPSEIIVSCDVPVPASLQLKSLNKLDHQDCFLRGPVELDRLVRGLESTPTNDTAWPRNMSSPPKAGTSDVTADAAFNKRQAPCGIWSSRTIRVGNGNQHQNPLNIQISDPMDYGPGSCTVGHSQARSFAIDWSASATAWQWLNGGFAVERSVETGKSYECHGNPHDYLALWKKVGQTAYTVQNAMYNVCTGLHPRGSPFVMWSPNAKHRGSHFYCVYSRQYVRWMGYRWIDTTPVPGGPR